MTISTEPILIVDENGYLTLTFENREVLDTVTTRTGDVEETTTRTHVVQTRRKYIPFTEVVRIINSRTDAPTRQRVYKGTFVGLTFDGLRHYDHSGVRFLDVEDLATFGQAIRQETGWCDAVDEAVREMREWSHESNEIVADRVYTAEGADGSVAVFVSATGREGEVVLWRVTPVPDRSGPTYATPDYWSEEGYGPFTMVRQVGHFPRPFEVRVVGTYALV